MGQRRQMTVSISGTSDMRKVKIAATSITQITPSILKVQKLVGTALTDNQVSFGVLYTLVDSDTQMEFYPISDVQSVKDVAPHVLETTVQLPNVIDESSGSIHYQPTVCLDFGAPASKQLE